MTLSTQSTGLAARFGLSATDLYPSARRAVSLLQSGRGEDALQLFAGLVLAAPEDHGFQLGLSESALATGHPDIALQAAAAALALDPANPAGYVASGRACLAMGEVDLAREDLTDAVRLVTEGPPASADQKAVGQIAARLLADLGHG